jgi:catechol 2,3-dioxygenase
MDKFPFAAQTPVSIGRVGLRARDANQLADYYKRVLGLQELRRDGAVIGLGAGGREILEIEGSSAFREDDPRSAGLYHTAFLLPERKDLGLWARHISEAGVPLEGAADHAVSEAMYLTDPEGNGIEVYVDRPQASWRFNGPSVHMENSRINFETLMGEIGEGERWTGIPDNSVIGHVHMRVGNVKEAEQWWNDAQGFDTMLHYGDQAVFLSSGGYHHHIGANTWHSKGSGPRATDRTGLGFVEFASKNATSDSVSSDPWGTEIRVLAAKA